MKLAQQPHPRRQPRGVIIGAPASGNGKTMVTLGLLRHLRRIGRRVASLKAGPDYIDPAYHQAASGRPCLNFDLWAMRDDTFNAVVTAAAADAELVIAEGVMGLFDGAVNGDGSTADLAVRTGCPVVLVVDAGAMAASAAAVVFGFANFRSDVTIAGVIFNRVGSDSHARLLRSACEPLAIPILGCVGRDTGLVLPDRHLGLVQAMEHPALEEFLKRAADRMANDVDVDALVKIGRPLDLHPSEIDNILPVLGQRIAVARDEAFAFSYAFVLDAWRQAGAEVREFSPLNDESPDADADAVYLPGGYPELHGGRLAANARFLGGLRAAGTRGATIYGECGGYMVLGRSIIDAHGQRHEMAGLLPLDTTFAERGLTLGYREVELAAASALGEVGARFRGHEFHYAKILAQDADDPLLSCTDASGRHLGPSGLRRGTVMGSFVHLIDQR